MASSGMVHRVALVRTDVSEELSASFIKVTRIGELGTTLAVTSNQHTLRRNAKSVLTRATRRNIPEDSILYSHRRENLKSYTLRMFPYPFFHHMTNNGSPPTSGLVFVVIIYSDSRYLQTILQDGIAKFSWKTT
jgi:hypothetical protein